MSLVQISLTEKQTVHINKKHFSCSSYSSSDFIKCSKEQLWLLLRPRINCTVAGYESIVPETFPYCDSLAAAQATMKQNYIVILDFVSHFSKNHCPLPCTRKSYNYNIRYLHRHSWIDFENSSKEFMETAGAVSLSYSSLLIEERVEAYVYDWENLMTSIGGNLGLFLGFSCFSTFVAVLKLCFAKFC